MERKPEEGETTYSVSTFDTGCPTSGSLDERSSSQLNLECVGYNNDFAGTNGKVAGNNGNVAGNNGNVAVNNGNVAGHNGNVAGNNDNVAGNNGNVAGNFNSRNITHNNNIGSMSIPTPNLLLADMVDVLIDILEEMRMMRANTSKVRLTETSVGLVTAEWHDIAMVLDRACFVGYSIANIVFAVAIAKRIPPEVHLEDVALPAKM
ncbi:hypothetical protein LSAT2_000617 [Lamellibrachia satsuma]|nr:hypothetical protein LSAT2_000617 [Lamellibrachia satsuma]